MLTAIFTWGSSFSAVSQQNSADLLLDELRKGGYTIYFRHERTEWTQSDNIRQAGDWTSCDPANIRQLSEAGRQRTRMTGEAIRQAGIPIGRIWASPYCRTMETAELMGLGPVTATDRVINMRISHLFGGREKVIQTARELLATPPAQGSNSIVVAHGNVARAATPAYPDEGEGLIFKADGDGGFRLFGRLTAEHWKKLSQ